MAASSPARAARPLAREAFAREAPSEAAVGMSTNRGGGCVWLVVSIEPQSAAYDAFADAWSLAMVVNTSSLASPISTSQRFARSAVGLVNVSAALTILIATPLVGLTFALPGAGRIGFLIVGGLWALAALSVPRTI